MHNVVVEQQDAGTADVGKRPHRPCSDTVGPRPRSLLLLEMTFRNCVIQFGTAASTTLQVLESPCMYPHRTNHMPS